MFEHCNSVFISLLSAKLKSTFAANYEHLSYKYEICQDNLFIDVNNLIAKMNVQFEKETQNISTAHIGPAYLFYSNRFTSTSD